MDLTVEEIEAVKKGRAVRLNAPEIGEEVVIVRSQVYDSAKTLINGPLPPTLVTELVDGTMAEYDCDDPLLDSYQRYRR
jgi:hypothetical protein